MSVGSATAALRPSSTVLWVGGTCVAALLAGVGVAVVPVYLAALVVLAILVLRPTATVLVALVVCQEVSTASGFGASASWVQVFGKELYLDTVGGVNLVLPFLALAAGAGVLFASRRRGSGESVPTSACLLVAVAGSAVLAVAVLWGVRGPSLVTQYGKPYLLLLLAIVLVGTTGRQPGGWRDVLVAATGALCLAAATGAVAFAVGEVRTEDDGTVAVFYDSALPAVAGAVVVVVLVGISRGRWQWIAFAAALTIVVLSGRRNVWLAVVVALLVVLLVRRGRGRTLGRASIIALITALVAVATQPNLLGAIGDRMLDGLTGASSGTGDASATAHVNDLAYGLDYALRSPVTGYGPRQEPLPGLVVQGGQLYVHNTYLLDWLRFGVVGLVVVTGLTVMGLVLAVRRLRRGDLPALEAVAALFLVIAPICAMTAGFFTTTQRWPVLLGLAAGVLLAGVPRADPDSTPEAVSSTGPDAIASRARSREPAPGRV